MGRLKSYWTKLCLNQRWRASKTHMRLFLVLAMALSGGSVVVPSHAQFAFSEYNKTVARLGAQGSIYYVGFVEPLGQNCQWGNVYVAADRKGLYAQLLAAKLAGKRISRIDYSQPNGNGTQCNADLVELTD
jgi:hypothetical protein